MEAKRPLHFFGVGAQKAGTTWLHSVLDGYPDCAVPPVKELHFFDVKYATDRASSTFTIYRDRLQQMVRMVNGFERDVLGYWGSRDIYAQAEGAGEQGVYKDAYLAKVNVERRLDRIGLLAEFLKIRNADSYVAHLEKIRTAKNATTVGEFTPSYSFLPEAAFREMNGLFDDARFIFIMRDPVDRFLSQLRFKKKRQKAKGNDNFDPVAHLGEALSDPNFIFRSNYRKTIETLENAVPKEKILYLFFEEMVAPESVVAKMRSVEQFLNLAPRSESELLSLVDEKKNVSEVVDFTLEQQGMVRELLDDVYCYVEDRFGFLPRGWVND